MTEILGKTIGQYQILEFVARGDTSFVYKGFQPTMNRYVAVKVLPPSQARNSELVDQFLVQAEVAIQLDHPNILPVYASGQDGAASFLVSRYIDSGTLLDRLEEYKDPRAALALLRKVADGLDYVHNRELVHGNLKPSNILLDDQGDPLLTDFEFRSHTVQMKTGNVYMSPEAALGGQLDARSDVYALGVLLYTMLVGQPPPVGTLPRLLQHRPDLPPNSEKVVLKAMAQYPEQRFESAGDFVKALASALGEPRELSPEPERGEAQGEETPEIPPVPVRNQVPAVERTAAAEPEPLVFHVPAKAKRQDTLGVVVALMIFGLAILVCIMTGFIIAVNQLGPIFEQTPTVTAVTNANVWSGPGTQYDIIGVLRTGQSAEAIGRSPNGEWWLIRYPNGPGGEGWVSVTVFSAQDTGSLPIAEPPPTPTLIPTATPVP